MAPVRDRVQKHREMIKQNPEKREMYLKKERERDKRRRLQTKEKLKSNQRLKDEQRKKIRERVKAFRERKKLQDKNIFKPIETSPIGSYKCNQTFGKAVKKVLKVLPNSPSKKTAIIKRVVTEIIGTENFTWSIKRTRVPTLNEEEKLLVHDFYCRDDVSRQAPGRKDVVTVWKKGECKKKYQKRHLLFTVGEVFQEFKKAHPEVNIGKSMFYSLRPCYVLLSSSTPHDVCVCKQHYNFINLLETLNKVVKSVPSDHKELLKDLSCNHLSENCMYGSCKDCIVNLDKFIPEGFYLSTKITRKQWENDEKRRPTLREHLGTWEFALAEITKKLPKFKKHCYVKKKQSDYFQEKKKTVTSKDCVIQMDFAENYSLISQDEIQSAHWAHSQVTICTFCIWTTKKEVMSYGIISNDLSHTKYSVWTFLKTVITDMKQACPDVTKVFIFSDNCAGQFKSRYTLSNLCFFEEDFGLTVEWNFFASSHGKGAMDGVGGALKRGVWTAVKSRKVIISNAADFYDYAQKNFPNIKVLWVDKSTVESNIPFLDKRWKNVAAIPQIQSCHHFQPYDATDLLIAKTANALMTRVPVFVTEEEPPVELQASKLNSRKRLNYSDVYNSSDDSDSENCFHTTTDDVQIDNTKLLMSIERSDVKLGLFVLVEILSANKKPASSKSALKQNRYIGICQSEVDEENDVKIMFLKCVDKNNSLFKIDEDDVCFVKFDQLLFKVLTPEIKQQGNRLFYKFSSRLDVA